MAEVVHVSAQSRLFDKFERDQFDASSLARGPFAIVGAILRAQGAILRDLKAERHLGRYLGSLALTTILFSAAYGAIMGLFQPGLQTLYSAAKLPIVVLGTGLLCTPTFYVFNAILGSPFTFRQTLATVLFLGSSTALVLVAFAPIAWFFTVSTDGPGFLVFFHLIVFLIAAGYGIRSLNTARRYLNYIDASHTPINGGFLLVWFVIVIFVALQMAYNFRPLFIPEPNAPVLFHSGERGLFFEAFGRWRGL
ncbi:MAG TPA: hypothetical protein VJB14_16325 [Planctomycetota bacterium]|nr:hypothetical protein [Planctomycetota bacterium]